MASRLDTLTARLPVDIGRYVLFSLLAAAVILGLFGRLHELGGRTLAIDEFYTVKGIEYILDQGAPEFPTGGYYVRGPLYQYIVAGSARLFGESGFAYRLPSALFSLLAIALAYLYARRFVGEAVALALAAALLLSSWHIEFARFIRMYALFQCATLVFLIALDSAYFQGRRELRYAPHLAVVLASVSHQMGILFAPLLFLPLLPGVTALRLSGWAERGRFALLGGLATVPGYLASRFDFRNLGVSGQLPESYEPAGALSSSFFVPAFPFWRLHPDPETNLLLLIGLVAAGIGALLVLRWRTRAVSTADLYLFAFAAGMLLHWFAVAAVALLVLVCRYRLHRPGTQPRRTYVVLAGGCLIGLGWLAWALADPARLLVPEVTERWGLEAGATGLGITLRALWTTFFGWPELYHHILRPFALELPLLGLLGLAALLAALALHGRAPLATLFRHPAFIIVYTMAFFAIFRHHSTTRYWFHLYPVLLCLIGLTLAELLQRWPARPRPAIAARLGRAVSPDRGAAALFLLAFALSNDFNPGHILRVADEAVALRTGAFAGFAPTWYPREDYRGPAAYVAANACPDARVIVDNTPPVTHYLDRAHAVFYDRSNPRSRYRAVSREGGSVDIWSGVPLLGTVEEVRAYSRAAAEVWLIRLTEAPRRGFEPVVVWGPAAAVERRFLSQDGEIEVLRIRPGPENAR